MPRSPKWHLSMSTLAKTWNCISGLLDLSDNQDKHKKLRLPSKNRSGIGLCGFPSFTQAEGGHSCHLSLPSNLVHEPFHFQEHEAPIRAVECRGKVRLGQFSFQARSKWTTIPRTAAIHSGQSDTNERGLCIFYSSAEHMVLSALEWILNKVSTSWHLSCWHRSCRLYYIPPGKINHQLPLF